MPIQIGRFALVLLLLILIDLVESSRDAASLFQSYHDYGYIVGTKYRVQAQPLYIVEFEWPPAFNTAADINIADHGPKSSELGRIEELMVRCSGLEQQLMRARRTKDIIKMGRSYRRLSVGSSLEEEQQLQPLLCLPYANLYDDDAASQQGSNTNIALKISTTSSRIMLDFLLSHPSFFLHLALAFLLLTFLASLLYFSMD